MLLTVMTSASTRGVCAAVNRCETIACCEGPDRLVNAAWTAATTHTNQTWPGCAQTSGRTTSDCATVSRHSSRPGSRRSISGPHTVSTVTAGMSSARNTAEVASVEPVPWSTTSGSAMNSSQSPISDTPTAVHRRVSARRSTPVAVTTVLGLGTPTGVGVLPRPLPAHRPGSWR